MKKGNFSKIIIAVLALVFLVGCQGMKTTYVDGAKIDEIYSIGFFTPTTQMTRMSTCTVEVVNHDGGKHGTPWTERKTTEECTVIGKASDGFIQNTSGPVGPYLLDASATVGGAMIINDGLRNQNVSPGDNINIDNTNSQAQGQLQGQAQGQSSYNSNRNSNYNSNRNNNYNRNSNHNSNRNMNNNRNNNQNRGRGHGGDN